MKAAAPGQPPDRHEPGAWRKADCTVQYGWKLTLWRNRLHSCLHSRLNATLKQDPSSTDRRRGVRGTMFSLSVARSIRSTPHAKQHSQPSTVAPGKSLRHCPQQGQAAPHTSAHTMDRSPVVSPAASAAPARGAPSPAASFAFFCGKYTPK